MNVLIVEDDPLILQGLADALSDWGAEVTTADSEENALSLIGSQLFNLLICDIRLGNDGSGITVAKKASALQPTPLIIAISGEATPVEAFTLAQTGVIAYIPKPIDISTFAATIEAILRKPPNIEKHVPPLIGKEAYSDIIRSVRKTMVEQALARSYGNRVQAAKLLKLSRQAVQQMIKDFELTAN